MGASNRMAESAARIQKKRPGVAIGSNNPSIIACRIALSHRARTPGYRRLYRSVGETYPGPGARRHSTGEPIPAAYRGPAACSRARETGSRTAKSREAHRYRHGGRHLAGPAPHDRGAFALAKARRKDIASAR